MERHRRKQSDALYCAGEQRGGSYPGRPQTEYLNQDLEMNAAMASRDVVLSIYEGERLLFEVNLRSLNKSQITFGSDPDNDIVIHSTAGIVSRHHGIITLKGNECFIADNNSTNGILFNGTARRSGKLGLRDVVSIGKQGRSDYDCITFLLGYGDVRWRSFNLAGRNSVSVGRVPGNDIVLPSPAVSAHHADFVFDGVGTWSVVDCNSFNGTFVQGAPAIGAIPVAPGDAVTLANATIVFMGQTLLYTAESRGVEVVARNLIQVRKDKGGDRVTNDNVSLRIKKGEFVAIVGGSGSGKTTLLNGLNGSDPAARGTVEVDGVDLYTNYGVLKNAIGYVPQQDIVYDNLKLIDMLLYAAELRMPPDTSKVERSARAKEVIEMLGLTHESQNFIGRLSGGQKKRASIAVEMLADPRLFYLDEPTSGLDPGTEKTLMETLAGMARTGRTVILVTHTTLNLHLCDQVVFLGPGGVLCFAGAPQQALSFFGVEDFVDVYGLIAQDPYDWARRFARLRASTSDMSHVSNTQPRESIKRKSTSFFSQFTTLSRRYAQLMINDTQRLILLIAQAPLLAALICLVAGEECFSIYEGTKSCLFALSCAAFWVGMLNSIQEICKERVVLKREYAGGVKISAYVLSKILVLTVLCTVQSLLLVGVFCALEGFPEEALWNAPVELFVTVLLTTLSAMCLGLLMSALFKNPDRAIAVAPILIMPQILFSGLIFKLEGIAETISLFVHCRWGMEAFGSTANLNALDLKIYENELIDSSIYEHEWEAAFEFTMEHLAYSWGVLGLFCIVCVVACGVVLRASIRK